jgi:hypothetical protein
MHTRAGSSCPLTHTGVDCFHPSSHTSQTLRTCSPCALACAISVYRNRTCGSATVSRGASLRDTPACFPSSFKLFAVARAPCTPTLWPMYLPCVMP